MFVAFRAPSSIDQFVVVTRVVVACASGLTCGERVGFVVHREPQSRFDADRGTTVLAAYLVACLGGSVNADQQDDRTQE